MSFKIGEKIGERQKRGVLREEKVGPVMQRKLRSVLEGRKGNGKEE